MDTHKATWAMFRRSLSKAGHLAERDRCIDLAREAMQVHCRAYDATVAEQGAVGVLVSGGVHEGWTREAKDLVGGLRRASHLWLTHARDHHRAAGLRPHTFPRLDVIFPEIPVPFVEARKRTA